MKTKEMVLVPDCFDPPEGVPWQQLSAVRQFRGHAMAPVVLYESGTDEVIGVLCFATEKPHELEPDDRRLMMNMAAQIGSLWHYFGPKRP